MNPQSHAELERLLTRLEAMLQETRAKFKSQAAMILGGSAVVAAIAAVREIWFLVPICLLFGAGIAALALNAVKKADSGAPVLEALRSSPESVVSIDLRKTSDTKEVFVTHWVEVRTRDHRLFVRVELSELDWILGALGRRCPSASRPGGGALSA